MTRTVRLRPWQKRALDQLAATPGPDFLAVATPGAGKTTFALTAARLELARRGRRRLVVVVPTQHLKVQWADAAARFDLHLEPAWSAQDGLPADLHGVVVTYQQVAQSWSALAPLARGAFTVFDEIHHAGDERAWGAGLQRAFAAAGRRLGLSGTPFRSDTRAIPFVNYRLEEAVPDFDYGYGEALAEGAVVRPIYFPRLSGEMEWTAPDGRLYRATFDDPLDRQRANQRLRTALSLDGEWLPAVLAEADRRLARARAVQPGAGGLVIAMDQDHARGIAALLAERIGSRAVVATSDDPTASERIARFAASDVPWLVAVRMVSEGVDIPRLMVGVFATHTTTELFFRQAVGRLVRWVPGIARQAAHLFIPDDVRLRTHAHQLADQRRHSLRRRADEDRSSVEEPAAPDPRSDGEQLSLFAALSATPLGERSEIAPYVGRFGIGPVDGPAPPSGVSTGVDVSGRERGGPAGATGDDDHLVLTLAPAPPPAITDPGAGAGAGPGADGPSGSDAVGASVPSRREERRRLRDLNAAVAAQLAQASGLGHAQVNAELNRLAGVPRVTEATTTQLQTRLDAGRRWLDRLRNRGRDR